MTDHIIAHVDDVPVGGMKAFEIDGHHLILLHTAAGFQVLGGTCPHHGAPLEKGALHGDRLHCPWHLSAFDARTGDVRQPCSLDSLPSFHTHVVGDRVIVSLPEEIPEHTLPSMARVDPELDSRVFLIVGAGAAGEAAAETLRHFGFQGRIVMFCAESERPYDRTECSKRFLAKADAPRPYIRKGDFYQRHGIELRLSSRVVEVDVAHKKLRLADGASYRYDQLLLATGSTPRHLNVPGNDLHGIHYLRTLEDCDELRRRAETSRRVTVIGGSFIGMEVAAALRQRDLEVHVVMPEKVPFQHSLGVEIGHMYRRLHEKHGVTFHCDRHVERFEGTGHVEKVVLSDGARIETDFCVIGVGVRPQTGYLKGLSTLDDGGVAVDLHLKAADDVYAVGDIAHFPNWRTDERMRVEHWRLAQQQGWCAARNMLGHDIEYRRPPFFWTNQYMNVVQYVGACRDWEEFRVVDGSLDGDEGFLAYYVSNGHVCGAAGAQHYRQIIAANELLTQYAELTVEDMKRESETLIRSAA